MFRICVHVIFFTVSLFSLFLQDSIFEIESKFSRVDMYCTLLIGLLLVAVDARVGVDVSTSVTKSEFECLRQPGGQGPIEFVIVRAYRSTGTVDPNAAATIIAASEAGIKNVDAYLFPCVPCGDGAKQVRDTNDALKSAGANYGMLWLDIERFKWNADKSTNQAFIKDMIDEASSLGIKTGIYAGYYSWEEIVGLDWDYAKSLPLWYAHYDNEANFDDFKTYGGWTTPSIKQYIGDHTSCGVDLDYDWYPVNNTQNSSFRGTSSV